MRFRGGSVGRCPGAGAAAPAKSLAMDQTRTEDGNILQVFSPKQAVMPVAVPKILVLVPLICLGRIVSSATVRRRIGGEDRRAMFEVQGDVALEMNWKTQVRARRELHLSATGRMCSIGGL